MDQENYVFAPDQPRAAAVPGAGLAPWKILLVDDDEQVHSVTRLNLRKFQFRDRQLELVSALSGADARAILAQQDDFALALVDVVMESEHSGLELVRYIREQLGNRAIRLVMRTGQPGQAPMRSVIVDYEVDDYKSKTELTVDQLYTTVVSSLRAFEYVTGLNKLNQELESRVAQRTEALAAAKLRAEQASKAKSAFLAHMSHELRTPLNAILGYAQILLRDQQLDEQQQRGLHTILQSGEHLLMLINDVLDLAKIESSSFVLSPSLVELDSLLEGIADIASIQARQKGIGFTVERTAALPSLLYADVRRLRQILLNLLANAINYTDHGSIQLSVAPADGASGGARLRFTVQDSGIGIRDDQLETIFQPFEQASGKERPGGTGLGLAISRELARAMGSEVRVESRIGQGSRFWFELPLEPASADHLAAPPAQTRLRGYYGPRKRVLVIDDVLENRRVLTTLLAQLDFETCEAANGAQALAQVAAYQPDLLIADLLMPGMGGVEMLARLRAMPGHATLPVIAVSASLSPEPDAARDPAPGADAFMLKPLDMGALLECIGQLLGLRWQEKGATAHAAAPAPEPACIAPPPPQLEALYQLAVIGNMRDLEQWAAQCMTQDAAYQPFATQIGNLAKEMRSKAILDLVQRYRDRAG